MQQGRVSGCERIRPSAEVPGADRKGQRIRRQMLSPAVLAARIDRLERTKPTATIRVGAARVHGQAPHDALQRAGLVESERRGMNVYHRPHRDAVGALCTVLDPTCCT